MANIKKIARRSFVIGSVSAAGGVAVGYWAYQKPHDNPLLREIEPGSISTSPYIMINADGITVVTPRAEMGQGVHTTLAAMVAEELEVELDQIRVVHGPASKAYFNDAILEEALPFKSYDYSSLAESARASIRVVGKFLGLQMTGGSSSIHDGFDKMRLAGASVKQMLVKAAANKWNVPVDEISVSKGVVSHFKSKSSARYQGLVEELRDIEMPQNVKLKEPQDWKVLGKSQKRVDMEDKCLGKPVYSLDVRLPNMLFGTVKMNPYLGAKGYKSANLEGAKESKGIVKILDLSKKGFAVLASNSWYAFEASKKISVDWVKPSYPMDNEQHIQSVSRVPKQKDSCNRDDGSAGSVLSSMSTTYKSQYRVPYLAHATLEPMNATVVYSDAGVEIWAGNQAPTVLLNLVHGLTGISTSKIKVHTTMMGGGFGRRAELDFVMYAVEAAMQMKGTPIQLTWTREEDMTHDFYRPIAGAFLEAGIDGEHIKALKADLLAPSVLDGQMSRMGMPSGGPDATIVQAVWDSPYEFDNFQVNGYKVQSSLPVSSWRSVGASQNAFFFESFMDELSYKVSMDPVDFRMKYLKDEPSRLVLQKVAEISGWKNPPEAGVFRGVAFCLSFGVPVAQVVTIIMTKEGIKIKDVHAVVDVGIALDPSNIEAQVESGIIFGLTAAMMGEITVKDGKVEQNNFDSYPMLRFQQSPNIVIEILSNQPKIRGIGEPGLPPIAPALSNAIFSATKKRVRQLPLQNHVNFLNTRV